MKNKKSFPYFLFRPDIWGPIIIVLIFFNTISQAQETPPQPDQFNIGTEFQNETIENTDFYDLFYASGMNTISQRADYLTTQQYLEGYNVLACNVQHKEDWIAYYTTCYYSKWEAEVDAEPDRVGFKHRDNHGNLIGSPAIYPPVTGRQCWSSIGLSEPRDSLMYGPLYRQDKRYKRGLYYNQDLKDSVYYIPRFIMALDNHGNAALNEDVCKIKVVFRYKNEVTGHHHDYTFPLERTLKVGDFGTSGDFNEFYLHPNPDLGLYCYPDQFWLPKNIENFPDAPSSLGYIDDESYTGIQYWVDWLGNDDLFTLYIDYVEVYDRDGWKEYIDFPQQVIDNITDYAEDYPIQDWPNLKYWLGVDEPYSIDCYEPIRVVDEIGRSVSPNTPVIVPFNPSWNWDQSRINGEDEISMFYNMANPSKITLSINPSLDGWPEIHTFEWLRYNFQRTSALDPEFWFNAQTHGLKRSDGTWCVWRKPQREELRAMVMLALAHGAKGIFFKWFDSYVSGGDQCGTTLKDCIVTPAPNIQATELYDEIKNNLALRLTGKLGYTLMNLDYTGEFIPLYCNNCPNHDSPTLGYLTIDCEASNYHWHAGFFEHKDYPDNNHFFLTNLRTVNSVTARLTVSNNTGYENVSFTDIEGGVGRVDTTIGLNSSVTYSELMPQGEGRLYRVAPVVLYGGRLLNDEYAGEGQVLIDDMIIENGATLTIYDNYNAEANITVKNGTILVGENGRINFAEGKKLIIEGTCNISGTSGDKLELVFSESQNDDQTGIEIKAGGTLTINNCKIENATIGINSLVNAHYLNVQNVDFINCSDIAINIAGYNSIQILTPPIPSIKYCTVTGSEKGIWASNLSQIIIRENNLLNVEQGIYLASVTTPAIIGNQLTGTKQSMGIFLESCNGIVRGNWITNHTNAIHLGNSSPDIGGNTIFRNWNRGLYVGAGSLPNMRGKLVQDPEHPNIFYAVSGYNKIYENGGWEPEDDGSEIFISDANALLGKGCNEIKDQRIPNTEDTPPLYNTQLLMNCRGSFQFIEVKAGGNFWDEHPLYRLEERFGECTVYLDPILSEPCPVPVGSDGKLHIASSTGEIIDTLYAEEGTIGQLTETELLYATAEGNFLTADFGDAVQIYDGIINSNVTGDEKYFAYQRKYEIGKLLDESPEFFNEMNNSFLALASVTEDTLAKMRLNQLATLSKVGEQEYETAIGEFDNIVQQNPNTEEAAYAEIDALTIALLIEEADSTLQKGRLGKYLIKSSANYHQRIDEILWKNFGSGSKETEKELLPTEYTLYQNYPNPFNPVTTIKYDLPNTSEVSLIIYDILGRKIKELVNTKQQAGRYEVQFNASNLASGVYIYQLLAEKFMSSRKMILLK